MDKTSFNDKILEWDYLHLTALMKETYFKLEWLQKLPTLELKDQRSQVYSRGLGKSLILRNVSYEHEGMWACTATTVIKGMDFWLCLHSSITFNN